MKLHYFDGAGICVHCDRCQNAECCPDSENEECDGQNWESIRDTVKLVCDSIKKREAQGAESEV